MSRAKCSKPASLASTALSACKALVMEATGCRISSASPFQDLFEKYLGLSSGIRPVLERYKNCNRIAEENRHYSEMIARDNAEGLKRSSA
mmetsp:Transcript_1539/g.1828  ORF Transcript_1539/g.1828 Transcript_1539/m.1828 type:complete len:90 (-) Transcript_1539:265-534(-)